MLGLLANWRLIVAGICAVGLLGLIAYARHEAHRADAAEQARRTAQVQVVYEQAAAKITDRRQANTAKIQSTTEQGKRTIHDAPDLDSALTDWRAALERVRASGDLPVTDPDGKR